MSAFTFWTNEEAYFKALSLLWRRPQGQTSLTLDLLISPLDNWRNHLILPSHLWTSPWGKCSAIRMACSNCEWIFTLWKKSVRNETKKRDFCGSITFDHRNTASVFFSFSKILKSDKWCNVIHSSCDLSEVKMWEGTHYRLSLASVWWRNSVQLRLKKLRSHSAYLNTHILNINVVTL